MRLCSDCQKICYNCDSRRELRYGVDEHLIRDLCSTCDEYPWCDMCAYLKTSRPGDLFLRDLDGVTNE